MGLLSPVDSGERTAPQGNENGWNLEFTKSVLEKHDKPANVDAVPSAAKIEIGDFVINTIERTATVQGENLRLTSAEFDVLVFLATHPQRCVTPRTVLATNWTDDDHHQTEFLKALLSLRRKLDAVAGGKQYLRTEPWVIDRFEPGSSFAA